MSSSGGLAQRAIGQKPACVRATGSCAVRCERRTVDLPPPPGSERQRRRRRRRRTQLASGRQPGARRDRRLDGRQQRAAPPGVAGRDAAHEVLTARHFSGGCARSPEDPPRAATPPVPPSPPTAAGANRSAGCEGVDHLAGGTTVQATSCSGSMPLSEPTAQQEIASTRRAHASMGGAPREIRRRKGARLRAAADGRRRESAPPAARSRSPNCR